MKVGIHEAKTKLSKLIPAALAGDEVIITKSGTPLVKLVPITEDSGTRSLGSFTGRIKFHGELLEPLPESIIEHFWPRSDDR